MKPWMLSELKDVLGCDVPTEAEITCVSTDTRDLPQGCLFVALRGEKFDAHDFVKQAIGAYQGVLAVEDSMASWRLSSRRMVCELSHAACQPRMG